MKGTQRCASPMTSWTRKQMSRMQGRLRVSRIARAMTQNLSALHMRPQSLASKNLVAPWALVTDLNKHALSAIFVSPAHMSMQTLLRIKNLRAVRARKADAFHCSCSGSLTIQPIKCMKSAKSCLAVSLDMTISKDLFRHHRPCSSPASFFNVSHIHCKVGIRT